jgi:thiosulfate/3-mercaptopyruvate sulfurtransferase
METAMRRLLLCSALLATARFAAADPLLVNSDWLAKHLRDRDLVLLHVGQREDYDAEHLEGARHVAQQDVSAADQGPKGASLEMSDPARLREQFAALGISDTSRVVVYFGKDWVSPATRVLFTLDAAGLAKNASLLDGGMPAWKRAGNPVSKAVVPAAKGILSPLALRPLVVDAAFVQAHVRKPGYTLIDARSPALYEGVQTGGSREQPHKTGHITGAASLPFNEITATDLGFRKPEQLKAMFDAAGAKPGDTIIGYCHIGQQATAMLYAARSLGYKVVLYDGSFEDWSRRGLPVTNPFDRKD